jgi:hypothetical protein
MLLVLTFPYLCKARVVAPCLTLPTCKSAAVLFHGNQISQFQGWKEAVVGALVVSGSCFSCAFISA